MGLSAPDRSQILGWLLEEDDRRLDELWREADRVRRERVGDAVHLRGLVEISNHCRRSCHYCGLRAGRRIPRYRMAVDEVLGAARLAARLGYGTVVLQSGEDPGLEAGPVADLVRRIKGETGLAVSLSLGERADSELAAWREAGADRYLLRFETSDRELFAALHPPAAGSAPDRVAVLRRLRQLGYEVGSGVMVGIPGQSWESLARDVDLFRELDLDMIGVGPSILHPDTPLGARPSRPAGSGVPATDRTTCKVLALARLVCPEANIPATTALAAINAEQGRDLGLARGANVWMPTLTSARYRRLYEIYPGRSAVADAAEVFHDRLLAHLEALNRPPGRGPGGRQRG